LKWDATVHTGTQFFDSVFFFKKYHDGMSQGQYRSQDIPGDKSKNFCNIVIMGNMF